MWELLFENPWILLVVAGLAVPFWVDHKLKDRRRGQIGRELTAFKREEHRQARPVYYPPNLRGKKGRVRAAAQDSAVDSFAQWRTWPFWGTLLVLALVGGAVLGLLVLVGVI